MRGRKANITITEENHPIEFLLLKAEQRNLYVVQSQIGGVGYIYDDGHMAIATSNGHIRMDTEKAEKMAEEILGILKDIERAERADYYKGRRK